MNVSAVSQVLAATPRTSPVTADGRLLFVFEGAADEVDVVVMEDRFPAISPMRKLREDIWYTETALDEDGSLEYRYWVHSRGKHALILDPLNPVTARGPMGENSVASGPGYASPGWLDGDSHPGTIEPYTLRSRSFGRNRRHLLYLPPGFEPAATYPLLILHDGPEYVAYAGLDTCLDVLITSGCLPPLIVFLHRPENRNQAYVDNPQHVAHVADEIIPGLRTQYRIGQVLAGGASLGAVAALSLAFRRPGAIDGLILQSGSLVTSLGGPFKRGRVLAPVTRLIPEILNGPVPLPSRVVMSCGTYDGLVEDHRSLVPRLTGIIAELTYREINAGHHWRCWRDRLEPDLLALLGPPTRA